MRSEAGILKPWMAALIVSAAVVIFASCEKYRFLVETVNPADTVYFQTAIQPIFNSICVTCHNGSRNPDLREGNSYSSLTSGYVDLPAESSKLYLKITSGSHDPFTLPEEKQKILIWIQQGAKNN